MAFKIKVEQGSDQSFRKLLNQNGSKHAIKNDDSPNPSSSFTIDADGKNQHALPVRYRRYARRTTRAGKIEDLPCEDFQQYRSGELEMCKLGKPKSVQGYKFEANTILFFDKRGKLKEVGGSRILCFGIKFPHYFSARFKDGKLWSIELTVGEGAPNKVIIQGYPFTNCSNWRLPDFYFHPNGQVGFGTLSRGLTIQGKRFSAGDEVCFDKNGKEQVCYKE